MANINFPANPTAGQTYTFNGNVWTYNGYGWVLSGTIGPQGPIGVTGAPGVGTTGSSIGLMLDGQGGAISTGSKGYLYMPYNGVITGWYLIAAATGSSVVIDVKKGIPGSGVSIVGVSVPTLTSQFYNSGNASGWTSSVLIGDILEFNVTSVSATTRLNMYLLVSRT